MMAVQYFWRHPLAEQVREEGRAQGRVAARAEMVLRILGWRDVPVPDEVRERVEACTDLDQLETWARRAVHAIDAAELFSEE
ncbi:hypothetical protein [Streptomyces sp. NPDC002676]